MKLIDLTGKKFGSLTVISRADNTKNGKARWFCKCDCGRFKTKPVTTNDLKSGKVQSCGCKYKTSNKENAKRHGETNTRIYRIWCCMRARCNYKHHKEYQNYGGRGITYSPEWALYENFRDWALNNGYTDCLTLDRIDTNKDYTPDNCRWATMKQQQNNRRDNILLTDKGETQTISIWAEKTGLSSSTLAWRLKHGWPESEIFLPTNLNNKNIRRKLHE